MTFSLILPMVSLIRFNASTRTSASNSAAIPKEPNTEFHRPLCSRLQRRNEKLATPLPSAGATGQADAHRRTQTYPLPMSAEDRRSTLCGMKKVHHEVLIGRLTGRLELMSQQTLLSSSSVQIVVKAREKNINCPTFLF
jgi:hypothetical protein